jgi:hypothetical protein
VGPFGTNGGTRWDQDAVEDHVVFERWNTLSNRLAEDVQSAVRPPGYDHGETPFQSSIHVTRRSCVIRPIGARTARSVLATVAGTFVICDAERRFCVRSVAKLKPKRDLDQEMWHPNVPNDSYYLQLSSSSGA